MRTSDSERQRVAEFLRDCCAEGRLGADELDERLDRLFSSHTVADAEAVVWDLPGGEAVLPRLWPAVRTPVRPPARRRPPLSPVVTLAVVALVVLLISAHPSAAIGLFGVLLVLGVVGSMLAVLFAPAGFVLLGLAWLAGRLWRGGRPGSWPR
jgi:hypothetical protein